MLSKRRFAPERGVGVDVGNALCLIVVVALLALPFIDRLGFYSDDWVLLADFQKDFEAGRFGIQSMLRGYESRPLQGIQLALQYYAFGLDPLPHHIANTAMLAGAIAAFYLLLARAGIGRDLALASAAIVAVLPQLSTARVWYSTFQIPTSLLLAMVSLHAQLSFARRGKPWLLPVAGATALASIAAYEIFAPLILAFPIWLIVDARRGGRSDLDQRRAAALGAGALATIAIAVAAKYMLTDRAQSPDPAMYMEGLRRLVKPTYDWRIEGSLNIFATVDVNLLRPFAGMAAGTAAAVRGEIGVAPVAAVFAAALLVLWRLQVSAERRPSRALATLAVGAGAFALAHTPFLINSQIMFSTTGIGNRALVAMAIGVAMMIAGAIGLLAPRRYWFAAAVSLIVLAAGWRTEQITSYWAQAWSIERRMLATARSDLAAIRAGSTIIFDGVCPYHGPAIVLETWEAEGMLQLVLGRPMEADTSADRMKITARGLTTEIYDEKLLYPYGPSLHVYDPYRRLVVTLPDRGAAERYFASSGRRRDCPTGYVGQGQLI